MRYSELKKLLKKNGCYLVEHGARHDKWYSPKTGKHFMLLRHDGKEAAQGTLDHILKDAGLK